MALTESEQELDAFQNALGDGWSVGFHFCGCVAGWTIELRYGAADNVMWESEGHTSLEDALQHVLQNRCHILAELED